MSEAVVTIERVGAQGDGVATLNDKPLFIPLTAPGDIARVGLEKSGRARLIELVKPGARREAPCPHFGFCGGCALQHLEDAVYVRTKEAIVREALTHRGLNTEIEPLRRIAPASRRRARFALARSRAGIEIGFRRRGSNHIADMRTCLVLHPDLFGLVPTLRELGGAAMKGGETWAVAATRADTGLDLLFELEEAPTLAVIEALTAFAQARDVARLSWHKKDEAPTPIVQRRPVQMKFGGTVVDLPPDCFLQASAEAEAVLTKYVLAGIGDADSIVDLFSGVGTFSFALAGKARVHAADGDRAATSTLQAAARRAGLARITSECRDLDRNPLRAEELNKFQATLFDPPYAGAKTQAYQIAASTVARVVAVSCHPASFARDARILVDGGYRLTRVMPVDQFVWSAEIELVAWFER